MLVLVLETREDITALLDQEDKTNDAREVLQRYLPKLGCYAPERKVDGDCGAYTKQAGGLRGGAQDARQHRPLRQEQVTDEAIKTLNRL